jgi:hypothetical protein
MDCITKLEILLDVMSFVFSLGLDDIVLARSLEFIDYTYPRRCIKLVIAGDCN